MKRIYADAKKIIYFERLTFFSLNFLMRLRVNLIYFLRKSNESGFVNITDQFTLGEIKASSVGIVP